MKNIDNIILLFILCPLGGGGYCNSYQCVFAMCLAATQSLYDIIVKHSVYSA